MKRLLLIFTSLTLWCPSRAQNLVPNYSFENKIKCPTNSDEFQGYVSLWTGGGGGGPSYFTHCSGDSIVATPLSIYGYQYAHTGVSYAGIYLYVSAFYNNRSYIQDSLTNSLNSGTKYFVTFYVSLADNYQYACNNMGAYFSDSSLNYSGVTVKSYLVPQITNDTLHNQLTDTIHWIKISGSFVAKGGEKYIIIGNFDDDAHSDTIFVNSSANNVAAYYFIDDVIVSPDSNYADSLAGVQNINEPKQEVKFFPNPASTKLTIEVSLQLGETDNICIYDAMGKEVRCEELINNITTLSIVNLSSGIYYYRITDKNGELLKSDKVMITH